MPTGRGEIFIKIEKSTRVTRISLSHTQEWNSWFLLDFSTCLQKPPQRLFIKL